MRNDLRILSLKKRSYALIKLRIKMFQEKIYEMDLLLSNHRGLLSSEEEDEYIGLMAELRDVMPTEDEEEEIEIPLQLLKLHKKLEILIYDSSENVNSFFINGISMWLTPPERTNYLLTVEAAKEDNLDYILFKGLQLPIEQVISALKAINLYAMQCTNVTEYHISTVMMLNSALDIENYDFTTGYPTKLQF